MVVMINWLTKFFGGSQPTPQTSHFSIEYYPLTKRYYPKYKDYYLKGDYQTGIIQIKEAFLFTWADYAETERGAEQIIEKFKEQQLKENVVTIKK